MDAHEAKLPTALSLAMVRAISWFGLGLSCSGLPGGLSFTVLGGLGRVLVSGVVLSLQA